MTLNADSPTPTDESPIDLDVVTVENEDAPDECAIFPREANDDELRTAWIVAQEDGFVSLESMR